MNRNVKICVFLMVLGNLCERVIQPPKGSWTTSWEPPLWMLLRSLCLFAPPYLSLWSQELGIYRRSVSKSLPRDRWDGNWSSGTGMEIIWFKMFVPIPSFLLDSPGAGFTLQSWGEGLCDSVPSHLHTARISLYPFSPYSQGPSKYLVFCLPETGKLFSHFNLSLGSFSRRSSMKGPCSC